VRPGREHDTTAARADPDLLDLIAAWVGDGQISLTDLGYEGEPDLFKAPFKKPEGGKLTTDQQTPNTVHDALHCLGERANPLLKTTLKGQRRYRNCPWHLSRITAATLVLPHQENHRTTRSHNAIGDHPERLNVSGPWRVAVRSVFAHW
jgi:hypothetical protein